MVNVDSPYWIDTTVESEEMVEKLEIALEACKIVHEWTMMEMRTRWNACTIKSSDLVPDMTKFIERMGVKDKAQRFSFLSTLSRAVSRFHQELAMEMTGEKGDRTVKMVFPSPTPPTPYRVLDIQNRAVWRKYMEDHHRISTHYGSVFLEGGWIKTILDQSFELRILPSTVPFLIYSATLREREEDKRWQVHFNFHKPESQQGKMRVKQSWQMQTE